MYQGFFRLGIITAALLAATHQCRAAAYISNGSAGETLATAEIVSGSGALDSISGTLAATNNVFKGALFQISITDPLAFSATTTFALGVNNFDSQLFLFNANGIGIVANDDDASSGAPQATIPAGSSYMSSQMAGTYYLLLEGSGRYAMSLGGLIFPNLNNGATPAASLVGATGAGGASSLSGVSGNSNEGGAYKISLTGASVAPEPSSLLLLIACGWWMFARQPRRWGKVLPALLGAWVSQSTFVRAAEDIAPDNLGLGLRAIVDSAARVRPASATRSERQVSAETAQRLSAFRQAQLDSKQRVLANVLLDGRRTPAQVRQRLRQLGAQPAATVEEYRHGLISAWVPARALATLARSKGISAVQLAPRAIRRVGKTTAQGVTVHQTTSVNSSGYQGANISIGVLSDSYNPDTVDASDVGFTKAAKDVTNGDLPGTGNPNGYTTPVNVLEDGANDVNSPDTDEGRAMLQIVHDLAPASKLLFATCGVSTSTFATNIKRLKTAGCQVICDDIGFPDEPMFSDGVVAQAVDTGSRRGRVTFPPMEITGTAVTRRRSTLWMPPPALRKQLRKASPFLRP